MTHPPSTMVFTTRFPCDRMDHVNGNLTCAVLGTIPCARSIPFPTAVIIQWDVGNSQPAYI